MLLSFSPRFGKGVDVVNNIKALRSNNIEISIIERKVDSYYTELMDIYIYVIYNVCTIGIIYHKY